MTTIAFRAASGPDDAPAFVAVHEACRETDRLMEGLRFENLPNELWYRDELAKSNPADWVIAQCGEEIVGCGHTLWSWAEADGVHVYLHIGCVKPDWRGKGIGRELLARLEARCREKATIDGNRERAELAANASSTEDSARQLLTAAGYQMLYTMLEMDFDFAQAVPDLPLPADYELRPVLPEHYRAVWQCIGDAYYVHGSDHRAREIATENDFRNYFHRDSADPTLWFVAWEPSRIAAVVLCRIENCRAEIYEVSVSHGHRRKGLAKALIAHALQELKLRDILSIRIVTRQENPSEAWRLYKAVGFKTIKAFPRWRKRM